MDETTRNLMVQLFERINSTNKRHPVKVSVKVDETEYLIVNTVAEKEITNVDKEVKK